MNVFDIIGPIMVGPSSSHTAGAAKIGNFCYNLTKQAKEYQITLYGSFAKTYKGHRTDLAIVGGILGYKPNNPKLRNALEIAQQKKIKMDININERNMGHPNACQITWNNNGYHYQVLGYSLGGGCIQIVEICHQKICIENIEQYHYLNNVEQKPKQVVFWHEFKKNNNICLIKKENNATI